MKTLLLGLDAFSPVIFEQLYEQGRLPNLGKFVQAGNYTRFAVTNPPQSEVSWTSIATGLNPGGHGIFDFVQRDPATYRLIVSLLPSRSGLLGPQFIPPFNAPTIFDQAVADGYPATALWWPGMFPARRQSPVKTIPGLGTPDIHGRLGVGLLFTNNPDLLPSMGKTTVVLLEQLAKARWRGVLPGPIQSRLRGNGATSLPLELEQSDEQTALCRLGQARLSLRVGHWTPVLELSFKLGFFFSVKVVTRLILTQLQPEVRLYALPLQLHPLNAPWPYGTPPRFIKKIWQSQGPFLTLGWPQDTIGLEDGIINDAQFLALCESIFTTRQAILKRQLEDFSEGVMGVVFDSLDRIQHMFWRSRPDVIEQWYVKLDTLVGQLTPRLADSAKETARFLVVSDHGFTDFNYKVHLNRWLIEQGYLVVKHGEQVGGLNEVDWSQSRAYALGLNSIYLNLAKREGQGYLQPDQVEKTQHSLRQQLLAWHGPDQQPVIQQVTLQQEAFEGPLSHQGPDLLLGFAPGYRASAQTGLGEWPQVTVEANRDHWHGDHCVDPAIVPGVLFSNFKLQGFSQPSYYHIPALALGKAIRLGNSPPPTHDPEEQTREDEKVIEERLKGLGYL